MKRMPPNNEEAESAVLGVLFQDSNLLSIVEGALTSDDFYTHKKLYQVICDVAKQGTWDITTVGQELMNHHGGVSAVGGVDVLNKILDQGLPSALDRYIQLVLDASAVRKTIWACSDIIEEGYKYPKDTGDYLRRSRMALEAISWKDPSRSLEHISRGLKERLGALIEGVPPEDKLETGLAGLSFRKPLLTILAGYTSMGKSAVALNIAQNIATRGHIVAYFTLEDSITSAQNRSIARYANIGLTTIKNHKVLPEQYSKIHDAIATLTTLPIYLSQHPATAEQIEAASSTLKAEQGLALVIIDHLGYMAKPGKEYDTVSQAVRDGTRIGKTLDVPVLLLCQLNRRGLERENKRPRLSDLRGSGHIEQDARAIWFLHRKGYYDSEEDPFHLEIIIAKNSDGETGSLFKHIDLEHMYVGERRDGDEGNASTY